MKFIFSFLVSLLFFGMMFSPALAVEVPAEFYSSPGIEPFPFHFGTLGNMTKVLDNGTKSASLYQWEVETFNDNLIYPYGALGLGTRLGENFSYECTLSSSTTWKYTIFQKSAMTSYYVTDGAFHWLTSSYLYTALRPIMVLGGNDSLEVCYSSEGSKSPSPGYSTYFVFRSHETYGNKVVSLISHQYPTTFFFQYAHNSTAYTSSSLVESTEDNYWFHYLSLMNGSYSIGHNISNSSEFPVLSDYELAYDAVPGAAFGGFYPEMPLSHTSDTQMTTYNVHGYRVQSLVNDTSRDMYRRFGNWTSQRFHSGQNLTDDASTWYNFTLSGVTAERTVSEVQLLDPDGDVIAFYSPVLSPGDEYLNVTGADFDGNHSEYWGNYSIRLSFQGDGNGTCFLTGLSGSDGVPQTVISPVSPAGGGSGLPSASPGFLEFLMDSWLPILVVSSAVVVLVAIARPNRRYRR